MQLSQDLREFVELLNSRKIKYVLVGGHAVAYHGFPRFTEDVDFLVETTAEGAARLVEAVNDFGFTALGLNETDFRQSDVVIQLGRRPHRIDLLTSITGVSFAEAWDSRIETRINSLPVYILSKELLLRNKRATGRAQDLADAERLGGDDI